MVTSFFFIEITVFKGEHLASLGKHVREDPAIFAIF